MWGSGAARYMREATGRRMVRSVAVGLTTVLCIGLSVGASVLAQTAPARPGYPTTKQLADSKTAQALMASAKKQAGSDLVREFEATCTALGPQRPAMLEEEAGRKPEARRTLEPIKLFDNVYYFGFSDVGSFAITTSAGIILIDALNSPQEAEEILIPGLRKVGLDPAQIKMVLVGHGHFDHFGGVPYLQQKYHVPLLMTKADWALMQRPLPPSAPAERRALPIPTQGPNDKEVVNGQRITLGDTTITLAVTPGHTPGSLGFFIPAKVGTATHNVLLLSGVIQTPDADSLGALVRTLQQAQTRKVEAVLNGHPGIFIGQTLDLMQAASKATGTNPLLYGVERFGRYASILMDCSRSRVEAMAGK